MKYALVTGSTGGIGLTIAKELIKSGYYVFINGRNQRNLFLEDGAHCFIEADVSCEYGVNKLFDEVISRITYIDCLVLNVGATCKKTFSQIELNEWQQVMDTNVNMPFLLTKKFATHISDNGRILFVSSAMSLKPHSISLVYGVSKAAVNALAQGLVKELAPRGICINSICPGFVDTEWQKEKPQWLRDKIADKIALKRFATPEEIADMCVKIIDNSYMNGAIVSVDGGYDME